MESNEPVITSNKDRHFRGQAHEEEVLAFCRKHWTSLFHEFFLFIFILVLIVLFSLYFQAISEVFTPVLLHLLILVVGTILTYYIHRFFLVLLKHYLTVIIITDVRILAITRSLYFVNEKESVDLATMRDVHKYQSGFLENMFNFGHLKITLGTSPTCIELTSIPNPEFHLRLINKAKQQHLATTQEKPLEED
ncbi:MAG: hypothetical protein NTX63_01345 [Candidatus Peregrinibacteria bacterium]|nr:hypothetical protein [Candidatus Peregrinibacteria bacterium]